VTKCFGCAHNVYNIQPTVYLYNAKNSSSNRFAAFFACLEQPIADQRGATPRLCGKHFQDRSAACRGRPLLAGALRETRNQPSQRNAASKKSHLNRMARGRRSRGVWPPPGPSLPGFPPSSSDCLPFRGASRRKVGCICHRTEPEWFWRAISQECAVHAGMGIPKPARMVEQQRNARFRGVPVAAGKSRARMLSPNRKPAFHDSRFRS
jgi:hypothetical protein